MSACTALILRGLICTGRLELLTLVFQQSGMVVLPLKLLALPTVQCTRISDHSFISLSKCSKLNTLDSRGCPCATSLGLAAVAVGCKKSQHARRQNVPPH